MGWAIRATSRSFLVFAAILLLFSFIGGAFHKNAVAIESPSPWLATEPTLKNLKENIPTEQIPSYVDGGQECIIPQKFVTRPPKLIPLQNELGYLSCGVDTAFGTIDKTAKLTRLGTNITGKMYSPNGIEYKLSPIPNSDTAMHLDFNAPSGAYITLERNIGSRLSSEPNKTTGEVKHFVAAGSSQSVKNEAGSNLYAKMDTAAFSANGQWAVFDAVGIGMTRLNVETGEILIFEKGYQYGSGTDPSLQLAISGDGRYAVVSSFGFSTFKIYDLSTCVKSSILDKPATCQLRDLKPILQSKLADHLGIGSKISFNDGYNLKFYGTTLKNNVRAHYIHLLTATGYVPVEFPYLALGDSFASGEGTWDYKPATDVINPKNKCHLSLKSYPYLIGVELGLNKYESIACSGAEIKDINFDFNDDSKKTLREVYNEKERQSAGLQEPEEDDYILDNFLAGYRTQYQFLTRHKPSKITLSISGNDMGFGHIISVCVFSPDTCYSQELKRAELVKKINDRFDELVKMYGQLKNASPGTDIYVVGYPKAVDAEENCKRNVHADRNELIFFNDLTDHINYVIKKAADNAGVFYVDVSNALLGYRLCENDGLSAINGLVTGDDKLFDIGPFGNESYHPNAFGHLLLKQTILEKTNNFMARNPFPKQVEPPRLSDAEDFIGSASYELLDINFIDKDMMDGWWDKSKSKLLTATGFDPYSTVKATLTSDPVDLGSFTAGSDGSLTTTLTLPDSVPYGYHTLHVSGQNEAGESIEYQQTIFITESENDYDGDGVTNEQDACLAIPPSGIDYDEDGVDDACDGEIGEPPEDTGGADIISSVQNQNQNALGQSSGLAGLQQGGLSQNSGGGVQQSGNSLFNSSSGISLNQSGPSPVLSSSTQKSDDPNKAPLKSSSDFPVFEVMALITVLIVLAWYVHKRLATFIR